MTFFLTALALLAVSGSAYYYVTRDSGKVKTDVQADEPVFTDPVPAMVEEHVAEQTTKPRKAKRTPKLPTAPELDKMTKAQIAELALVRGLALDLKKTKAQMIEELLNWRSSKAIKQ